MRLPIIMYNVIKTHVNHNVCPVVDTSCSHDGMFLHLCPVIEYRILIGWVTSQTRPLTTLDVIVVLPIYFRGSDANKYLCHSTTNQSKDLGEWLCIHILPHIWFSIFDGITFPYLWCLELTCPGPECLMLNPKLINGFTQFLFWLVTVKFPYQ